jgi:hypothetical protein
LAILGIEVTEIDQQSQRWEEQILGEIEEMCRCPTRGLDCRLDSLELPKNVGQMSHSTGIRFGGSSPELTGNLISVIKSHEV